MNKVGILGAALVAAGALWAADPSITLNRVQQRYPWNGKVDIDYTVADVPDPSQYYVRFKVTENEQTHELHAFANEGTLIDASNGTYRVTWQSEDEGDGFKFFATNANVQAELVYSGADKSNVPYNMPYFLVIDLTEGARAANYPVSKTYLSFDEATNRYNTSEYKTNKLVLRRVRKGVFTMGSPADETGHQSQSFMNKETQHEVTLTQDFLLGLFPVTQAQYTKVMGTNPAQFVTDATGNLAAERPVERVSYQTIRGSVNGCAVPPTFGNVDANSFMEKISTKTGLAFDLPTEAQWEYACRAGTTTCTYAGAYTATPNDICWYNGNAASTTHGVGQKLPNAWGFYDTLGNIWEWCRDRVTEAPNDDWGTDSVTDPLRGVNGNAAIRGGGFGNDATTARAACRYGIFGVSYPGNIGFRLSRTLP